MPDASWPHLSDTNADRRVGPPLSVLTGPRLPRQGVLFLELTVAGDEEPILLPPVIDHINALFGVPPWLRWQLGRPHPPRRILDVGCGRGVLTRRLAAWFPDAEVLGVDREGARIEAARVRALPNQRFRVMDAEEIGTLEPGFDLVFSRASFSYWRDPVAVVLSAVALLADGGRVVIFDKRPESVVIRLLMATGLTDRLMFCGVRGSYAAYVGHQPLPDFLPALRSRLDGRGAEIRLGTATFGVTHCL